VINQPRLDQLLSHIDSPYKIVVLSARRARQLHSWQTQKEDFMQYLAPPMIESNSNNALQIALEEIEAGVLSLSNADSD
jgi:DNA-directed RNA polymerase subunit omega